MSNFGFGFGQFGQNEPGRDPDDIAGKIPLFAELQRLLAGSGGPVNWDLARQLAISSLAGQHRRMTPADQAAVVDAVRLADVWLDGATDLPSGITTAEAWSQIDWVEKTIGTWSALCDPVASRVVTAMSGAIPPEMAAQAGPMAPMMSQLGGMMFGAQLGQGIAALADEVVSSTEIGLPLGPTGTAALVLANLDALAGDLERPVADVRLFMALREAAHHRLFSHVPWLRQQLLEAVDAYGRGISIDPTAISAALNDIDPNNPESLQNALAGGLFEPENTDAQNAALRRLETLLALIEGWVDAVVGQAAGDRLPGGQALTEAIRRRRASGGPAEQTFATLVGLEMRPRRLRDAAALWTAMYQMHGTSARDGLWNHPDLLPSADDLDDPVTFAAAHGAAQDLRMPELDDPELGSFRPRDEAAESETPVTEPGMPAADAATPPPAGTRPHPSDTGRDGPGNPAGSGAEDTASGSGESSGKPDEPGESQS
ncbi:MAG: zinc-dependent metalloprotease, partial [Actinobacteria bacterium]|nr:zinc-dependent metalloprotease [Actinomycetota bacterium]